MKKIFAYALILPGIFFLSGCQKHDVPFVGTLGVDDQTNVSATIGGNVTSDGGAPVSDRGVYWGNSSKPENDGTKLQIGSGIGIFSKSLTGLTPGTKYYIRAFAINSEGISYGEVINFTTVLDIASPTVTTSAITVFTSTSATVGGNVTSTGGASVSDRGVYWSTQQNPDVNGTKFQIGSGSDVYSNLLTGLIPNTTYYIKAYAINSKGISYGDQVSFKTSGNPILVLNNYNDIYTCNIDGTNLTQLTTGSAIDSKAKMNYAKTKIAFISNRTGSWQIFLMNVDGTGIQQLTTTGVSGGQNNGNPGDFDWTSDGRLVYIKGTKIYRMNSDGTNVTEIATAPSNYWSELRCSPINNKIAAQTQGSWGYTLTMYIMNSDGSGMSVIASDLAGVQFIGNFTKDDLRFLYTYDVSGHEDASGQSFDDQIVSVKLDGTSPVNLSANKSAGSNDLWPVYSPDASKIYFINNITSTGVFEVWGMNADGTGRARILTNGPWHGIDCK